MTDTNVFKLARPGTFPDSLTEILRSGARALLTKAVEAKVADFLRRHIDLKTEAGHRRLVRHVHLPEREIMTGTGPVAVRQPRVRDRDRPDLKGRDQVTTSLLTCARSDPDRHLEGSLTTPLSSG